MKFLVDAQLPVRLALLLNGAGHEAIHTSDLPNGNASTDAQVVEIADAQDRVVVTKDRDFRDGHLLTGSPRKLFIVATGNISNDARSMNCLVVSVGCRRIGGLQGSTSSSVARLNAPLEITYNT